MKKIFSLILLFAALRGMAQTVVQPQGAPNVRSEFRGQLIVDSIEWVVIRDTNYIPPFEGAIDFRPGDRLFYTYNLGRWNLLGGGMWGKITGSITSQTDLYDTLLARQFVITNQYGIKVIGGQPVFDSAGVRKVDTLYRIDDTTVGFKINTIPYSFKIRGNSAGAGGIALSMPNIFTVTGSPAGFGGTLITTFNNQSANTFLGGPTTGSPGQPAFRTLIVADIPTGIPVGNLAANTIGLVLGSTGTVPNVVGSPALLGNNLTLNIPNAGPGSTGFLTNADWITFNGKVTSVNGFTGVVIQKSADSIKHLPVDTSVNRNNYVLTFDSTGHRWYLAPGTGGGGSGSVTSVGLSMPGIFNVTGSPVTTSGTLTAALANQTQNLFFASPNGSTGTPAFRAFAYADMPNSGISAGSYSLTNLTVNAQGIITAISNGTGGPILSINGLNAATQVFAIGSAGTAPNIVSATATHTFNFPYASAADTGVLKSGDWTVFNNKVGGIGTLNSASKSANGANVVSGNLILQTVDHTFPGLMLPADKAFLDSVHSGLYNDSIFVKNEGASGVNLAWASGTDTLHFKKIIAGTNVNFTQNSDSSIVINATLSGGGSTNLNIGSGYRFAVPSTNNIKTLFCSGCTLDSTTNTNALTLTVTGGGGTLSNVGSGFRAAVSGTSNVKTFFAGAGITIDSTTNTNGLTIKDALVFNNGITNTTGTVQLGGTLIKGTTISSGNFTLIVTGSPTSTGALAASSSNTNAAFVATNGNLGSAIIANSTLGSAIVANNLVGPAGTFNGGIITFSNSGEPAMQGTATGGGEPGLVIASDGGTGNETIIANGSGSGATAVFNASSTGDLLVMNAPGGTSKFKNSGQLVLGQYVSTSSYPGTATANLAVDASGNVITVATGGGSGSNLANFYLKDSALSSNRTVTQGTNFLNFTGASTGNTVKIDNTNASATGYALQVNSNASGTLNATNTNANGIAGYGIATGSFGTGLEGDGFLGVVANSAGFGSSATAFTGQSSGTGMELQTFPSSNNTVQRNVWLQAQSGSSSLTGFGQSIDFDMRDSLNAEWTTANRIVSKWTNAVSATTASQMEFWTQSIGTSRSVFNLKASGQAQLPFYLTTSSFPVTAVGMLVFDASGNIGTQAISGGGGSTNSNIGSGYRLAVPSTNNIKTVFSDGTLTLDSTTNTNGITTVVTHPLIETSITVSSPTTSALSSGDKVWIISIIAASSTSGFQVGTTPTGADVISNQTLGAGVQYDFTVNHVAHGSETLYFQAIGSSTTISINTFK